LKKRGLTPQLVLTGAAIRPIDSLKALARQLDCDDQLLYLGYVKQHFFPGLYRNAACHVFPLLFEGFGIPLVEAMATGCPIACEDVCSIPEVVGEAAMMFDPRNPDFIADAVETLLRDPEVGKQLAEKGLKRFLARFPGRRPPTGRWRSWKGHLRRRNANRAAMFPLRNLWKVILVTDGQARACW